MRQFSDHPDAIVHRVRPALNENGDHGPLPEPHPRLRPQADIKPLLHAIPRRSSTLHHPYATCSHGRPCRLRRPAPVARHLPRRTVLQRSVVAQREGNALRIAILACAMPGQDHKPPIRRRRQARAGSEPFRDLNRDPERVVEICMRDAIVRQSYRRNKRSSHPRSQLAGHHGDRRLGMRRSTVSICSMTFRSHSGLTSLYLNQPGIWRPPSRP